MTLILVLDLGIMKLYLHTKTKFVGQCITNTLTQFFSCDLDLDPITLIYELDLDILICIPK